MRTTVDLDEDVLRLLKHFAEDRRQSLGRVLSDILRQHLGALTRIAIERGKIPILRRTPGAQPVTVQVVKDLLELQG
jgi:hypothetical protein